eukprot:scaffold324724_cov38-Prasinocladus_malaysianus.AAC.2
MAQGLRRSSPPTLLPEPETDSRVRACYSYSYEDSTNPHAFPEASTFRPSRSEAQSSLLPDASCWTKKQRQKADTIHREVLHGYLHSPSQSFDQCGWMSYMHATWFMQFIACAKVVPMSCKIEGDIMVLHNEDTGLRGRMPPLASAA